MKKSVESLEDIYGHYLTVSFVENLRDTSNDAKARARMYLTDLVSISSTEAGIEKCIKAEKYWSLLEDKCKTWLRKIV